MAALRTAAPTDRLGRICSSEGAYRTHRLHAKLYLCHRDDTAAPRVGYVGIVQPDGRSGLRDQGELNVDVVDGGDATEQALPPGSRIAGTNPENALMLMP